MISEPYSEQTARWPPRGRHILGQFDDSSIVVYQAFRQSIAAHAVSAQRFGGEFSYSRMSWIKPNFLWMMYRCSWASKEGQERVLAIRLSRIFFDELLRLAVSSSYDAQRFASQQAWQSAIAASDVRLQWDPDHDPTGRPIERRAVQLGLRGETLRRYGEREPISIEDVTPFVLQQRENLQGRFENLLIPAERVYGPELTAARAVGVD